MKQFIIILLAVASYVGVAAQSRIDKVIADLENKNDVETTYSERRTAKKHKLYRITTVLNFNNDNYYKRLARAFEDEREKAVSAVKSNNTRTYKFVDEKGTSSYTLTHNSVVKSWRSSDDNSDDEGRVIISTDPAGDVLVSKTCLRNESRREQQKMCRELDRQHREMAEEFAEQQREFARQQREFVRQQREFERQQRDWARQVRQHEEQMRNLAGI